MQILCKCWGFASPFHYSQLSLLQPTTATAFKRGLQYYTGGAFYPFTSAAVAFLPLPISASFLYASSPLPQRRVLRLPIYAACVVVIVLPVAVPVLVQFQCYFNIPSEYITSTAVTAAPTGLRRKPSFRHIAYLSLPLLSLLPFLIIPQMYFLRCLSLVSFFAI